MNSAALTLMLSVQIAVVAITGWFYYRVLSAPPKPEPDSYEENDRDPC